LMPPVPIAMRARPRRENSLENENTFSTFTL